MSDAVAAQYEAYPYPPRDPADERKRLRAGSPSHLWEVNHYVFGGALDPKRPFRALVAGGGTGDGLIGLAQHCVDAGLDAEITYVDLSRASRAIADARAKVRGLTNIRFLTGSLLEIGRLAPGPYDYIDCCGVLHHLEDPVAGLRALAEALAPSGGLGLMVYGTYGRTGVYPMQHVLRALTAGMGPADKVALSKRVVAQLPSTNWLLHNPLLVDHQSGHDSGFYDTLLHDRDRSYTVPELIDLIGAGGLAIAAFPERLRYDPRVYLRDPAARERAARLPLPQRWAMAEALAGNMHKHTLYLVHRHRQGMVAAQPDDPSVIPVPYRLPASLHEQLGAKPSVRLTVNNLKLDFALPDLAQPILAAVDGEADLAAIHRRVAGERNLTWAAFKTEFDRLYGLLNGFNRMLLRRPGSAYAPPRRGQDEIERDTGPDTVLEAGVRA